MKAAREVVKYKVLGEIRFRQLATRRALRRLWSQRTVYGVYREVGHNRLQSWAAAEREVRAVEYVENCRVVDKIMFRMECERDFAALQVTE